MSRPRLFRFGAPEGRDLTEVEQQALDDQFAAQPYEAADIHEADEANVADYDDYGLYQD